jgi:hypothetical protein
MYVTSIYTGKVLNLNGSRRSRLLTRLIYTYHRICRTEVTWGTWIYLISTCGWIGATFRCCAVVY